MLDEMLTWLWNEIGAVAIGTVLALVVFTALCMLVQSPRWMLEQLFDAEFFSKLRSRRIR